jgi:hypothetical protein
MRKLRGEKVSPLRNYLYISDAKLDMFFEQIDKSILKRISVEVRVDLKLASVTLRKAEDPVPARIPKLRVVERFIDEHHHVGSIENPGREYFRGQMDMQWGWLAFGPGDRDRIPIVYFRGKEHSQLVMLAGSRRHVLGEHPAAEAVAMSALPAIIGAIDEHISEPHIVIPPWSNSPIPITRPESSWSAIYAASVAKLYPVNTPTQQMEFLAIPLAETQLDKDHAILGTPLYVALARETD